jgi:hypothetical protein
MNRPILLTLALITAVAPLGCKKIREKMEQKVAEKAVEGMTGGQVQIEGDKVTVNGKDGNGSVQFGTAKLPDDWPSEIPVYPGAKLLTAMTTTDKGVSGHVLTLETTDSVDKVITYYKSKLSGYKSMLDMSSGEGHTLALENDATHLQVNISATPQGNTKTNVFLLAGKGRK